MCENQLWEQIKRAQNEKGQALLLLVEKFLPLIYKYAGCLGVEDAKEELQCVLITVILSFNTRCAVPYDDPAVLSYIQKSVYHAYIARSKLHNKEKNCRPICSLSASEQYKVENITAKSDDYHSLLADEIKGILNAHEYTIIYQHFFLGFSIEEIALECKVSRQSVNQSKKRALKKLEQTIFKK